MRSPAAAALAAVGRRRRSIQTSRAACAELRRRTRACSACVSSSCAKTATGKPAPTSAIGPCCTSAALNASAWMPQVSLNLSAASCAAAGRGRDRRRTGCVASARPSTSADQSSSPCSRAAARARARAHRATRASSFHSRGELQHRRQRAEKLLVAATLRSAPAHAVESRCRRAARAASPRALTIATTRAPAASPRFGLAQQVRALARLRDREEQRALRVCCGAA